MVVVVCYDIKTDSEFGQKRLRQVASVCSHFGIRVQNSVFELDLTPSDFEVLKKNLESIIDKNVDSIRIYRLGKNGSSRTMVIGNSNRIELGQPLLL